MFYKIWATFLFVGSYCALIAGMYYVTQLRMYNCFLMFFLAQFLSHQYGIGKLRRRIDGMEQRLGKKKL
jgi:hypothetical protein